MSKIENEQNMKMHKSEKLIFPLRPKNAIPYGRRGTPWKPQNPKNAGPGGSEITKCRFWSFICHFGHFWGFLEMSLFSLFMILVLSLFDFFTFCILLILSLFDFFTFSCFCVLLNFDQFLSFFVVVTVFVSIFVTKLGAQMMTHFSPREPALPLSPFW